MYGRYQLESLHANQNDNSECYQMLKYEIYFLKSKMAADAINGKRDRPTSQKRLQIFQPNLVFR